MTSCPTECALAALVEGTRDAGPELDEHVQRCAACQARLEALTRTARPAAPDPLAAAAWGRARAWVTAHPPPFDAPADAPPEVPGFEIETALGRGASGVVYAARESALARRVAVKLFHPLAPGSEARTRFQREAESLARLHHPHVLQVYRVGEAGGRPYLVTEYAEGGSLADQLTGEPWPARRAAEMLLTLARAVEYAHRHGVIHRDLKPGNVLFGEGDVPKIADFGLAVPRQLAPDSASEFATGTPGYAAPEQLAATDPSAARAPAVDVYSLGAILYELLTGRPPFRAARPLDTVYQTVHQPAIPPARLEPRTPYDLEVICLKCLAKEPAARYAAAGELAADLHRFLVGKPIRARPVSPAERAKMWAKRHPVGTAGLLLVVALLVSSGVLLVWLWQSAEEAATSARAARGEAERRVSAETAYARESQRRNAELLMDRAISLCERGEVESGLMALNDLKKVLTDRDADLWRLLRWNRAAWDYRHVVQLHRIPQSAPVTGVSIDPQSARCAVVTASGCRLWSLVGGEPLGDELRYETGKAAGARWSAAGDAVAVWGTAGARFWDADGRALGHALPKATVTQVASLAGGGWVVAARREWGVWDRTGGPRFAPRALKAEARAVGAAGDRVYVGLADGTLLACDPNTGAERESVASGIGAVASGGVAPGGAALAGDEQIQLFRFRDEIALTHLLKPRLPITAVALGGDAPRLAGFVQPPNAPAGQLLVWDAGTGLRENTIVCDGPLSELHLSHDADRVLSGSASRRASVWLGAVDGACELRLGFTPVHALALSANGRYAVVGRGATAASNTPVRPFVQIWKLPDDQRHGPPVPLPGVSALAATADGRLLTGDTKGAVRPVNPLTRAVGPALAELAEPVRKLVPHPTGAFVLAATEGTVHVLHPTAGTPLRPPLRFAHPLRSLALSADGRYLVVGGRWHQYAVWDTTRWELVGPQGAAKQSVAHVSVLSDRGAVLVAAPNGALELRDLRTGDVGNRYQLPTPLEAAALSPDGRTLVVGSNRRTVYLVDASTGREQLSPYLLSETVADVHWHPDGRSIFARTIDGLVRHIDAGTMRPIGPPLLARTSDVAIAPDGTTVWAAHARGLTAWRVPKP